MNFEVEVEVTFKLKLSIKDYTPARPAPPCSNPDDPRYSDPGDDEYYEVEGAKLIVPLAHNMEEIVDIVLPDEFYGEMFYVEQFESAIREKAEEIAGDQYAAF